MFSSSKQNKWMSCSKMEMLHNLFIESIWLDKIEVILEEHEVYFTLIYEYIEVHTHIRNTQYRNKDSHVNRQKWKRLHETHMQKWGHEQVQSEHYMSKYIHKQNWIHKNIQRRAFKILTFFALKYGFMASGWDVLIYKSQNK